MRLLLFFAQEFWFKPFEKTLEAAIDTVGQQRFTDVIVVFYHCEAHDVDNRASALSKFVKNIKWIAGKFKTTQIVLHSFNHLSVSKAPADFGRSFIAEAIVRLVRVGFTLHETPYGYVNEWNLHIPGNSLARVFKEL